MKIEDVRQGLNAFLGLFTQPFEQDLKASVTAAATSISLAGLESLALVVKGGGSTALEISGSSLVLVLVWMAVTAVVTDTEHRRLILARNLSVLSFWIAVTLIFVIAVALFFPNSLARAIRLGCVWVSLLVLVPVHMFRNLPFGAALRMTLVLWFSTGTLAWMAVY